MRASIKLPELRPDGAFRRWTLIRAFVAQTRIGSVTVPAGFVTDFASVPRALWVLLAPFGLHSPAAIVHDYLYAACICRRVEADLVFLDLMKEAGVRLWLRWTMYGAVRAFGWLHTGGPMPGDGPFLPAVARFCTSAYGRIRAAL